MAGQPKTPFYLVMAVVVAGLVAFAVYRSDIIAPRAKHQSQAKITLQDLDQKAESADGAAPVTTVKEYSFKAAERLPEIKETSHYVLKDNTVRFALNIWAGWAPIILANNGIKPGKVWKTPEGEEFKVELVVADDPVAMLGAYTSGEVQIGWGTLDMVPLFIDGMVDKMGQPRKHFDGTMPRIFQQIDWSNGGDGIVVRENVKTVADLRDKTLVLAQNSPSQYFALNMLVAGGVQPSEVNMIYTNTAFAAAAAFNADKQKKIAGAVSWSPDIYNLEKVKGNRMLVNTQTANKLIADIWFARADFAQDHPGMIEALVRGIFDAMEELKKDAPKQECSKLMAAAYNLTSAEDAMKMFDDAHNTNWAENYQFFLNQNNPTNFEHVWRQSYSLYRQIGTIQNPQYHFDQVMDFSVIQKLGGDEKYKSQHDEYQTKLAPTTIGKIRAESPEILTNTVVIHFAPNDWNLHKKNDNGSLYDPNVDNVLKGVGELVGTFGAARVIIEGHTDASMRNQVPAELVKTLSMNRAAAVRDALAEKYPDFDASRFYVDGLGWDRPADPQDPSNHGKNRRVEIKVYPAEKQ